MNQPAASGDEGDLLPDSIPDAERVRRLLGDALRGLRFGQVLITIHEGRVMQIDRTERFRVST